MGGIHPLTLREVEQEFLGCAQMVIVGKYRLTPEHLTKVDALPARTKKY
jgi:hypothetical protein